MTRNNVNLTLCSSIAQSPKPRNKAVTSRFKTPVSVCGIRVVHSWIFQPLFPCQKQTMKRVVNLAFTKVKNHTIPLQNSLCLKLKLWNLKTNAHLLFAGACSKQWDVFPQMQAQGNNSPAQGTQKLHRHLIFIYHTFHRIISIISREKEKPHYFRYW